MWKKKKFKVFFSFQKSKTDSSRHSAKATTNNRACAFQYVTLPSSKTDENGDNRYLDHTSVLPGYFYD